jgi:hypothetical protein
MAKVELEVKQVEFVIQDTATHCNVYLVSTEPDHFLWGTGWRTRRFAKPSLGEMFPKPETSETFPNPVSNIDTFPKPMSVFDTLNSEEFKEHVTWDKGRTMDPSIPIKYK